MTVLTASAKLTLELRITGVRADGYHLIDAEMVTLDLADEVVVEPTDGTPTIEVAGRYANGVPTGPDNLVARALESLGRRAHVRIDKRIPHGGGLGGGSADAAAVLRWGGHPTDAGGLAAAARLGADVAFCLVGGRARVTGIGEIVEPLPHVERTVTLFVPPIRVSTPDVYRAWDELGGPNAAGPNDLEPAAISVSPELGAWRDRIEGACGATPILAGSGATWFVHGEHESALAALRGEGVEIITARTVPAVLTP